MAYTRKYKRGSVNVDISNELWKALMYKANILGYRTQQQQAEARELAQQVMMQDMQNKAELDRSLAIEDTRNKSAIDLADINNRAALTRQFDLRAGEEKIRKGQLESKGRSLLAAPSFLNSYNGSNFTAPVSEELAGNYVEVPENYQKVLQLAATNRFLQESANRENSVAAAQAGQKIAEAQARGGVAGRMAEAETLGVERDAELKRYQQLQADAQTRVLPAKLQVELDGLKLKNTLGEQSYRSGEESIKTQKLQNSFLPERFGQEISAGQQALDLGNEQLLRSKMETPLYGQKLKLGMQGLEADINQSKAATDRAKRYEWTPGMSIYDPGINKTFGTTQAEERDIPGSINTKTGVITEKSKQITPGKFFSTEGLGGPTKKPIGRIPLGEGSPTLPATPAAPSNPVQSPTAPATPVPAAQPVAPQNSTNKLPWYIRGFFGGGEDNAESSFFPQKLLTGGLSNPPVNPRSMLESSEPLRDGFNMSCKARPVATLEFPISGYKAWFAASSLERWPSAVLNCCLL